MTNTVTLRIHALRLSTAVPDALHAALLAHGETRICADEPEWVEFRFEAREYDREVAPLMRGDVPV